MEAFLLLSKSGFLLNFLSLLTSLACFSKHIESIPPAVGMLHIEKHTVFSGYASYRKSRQGFISTRRRRQRRLPLLSLLHRRCREDGSYLFLRELELSFIGLIFRMSVYCLNVLVTALLLSRVNTTKAQASDCSLSCNHGQM